MRVLIYEPHPGGHRFEYVARILPMLNELGVQTTLVSSKIGFASSQFLAHLGHIPGFDRVPCSDDPLTAASPSSRVRASFRELRRSVTAVLPDHLYFPAADGVTQLATLTGLLHSFGTDGLQSEALHFAGGFGYSLPGRLRRCRRLIEMKLVTNSPWTKYWHVDPWQLAALRERQPKFAQRSMLLPDPVDLSPDISRCEARKRLGLPEDGLYFGMAGPVSQRKRIDLLLPAFRLAKKRLPGEIRLLIAGTLDADAKSHLKEHDDLLRSNQVFVLDKYFGSREMELLIPAMDVVVLPYEGHLGSSGMVLRAAAAGRPVVASNTYWLNKTIHQFDLGRTCPIHDLAMFANTLVHAAESAGNHHLSAAAKRYLAFQSQDNFEARWVSLLRSRLGLPEDPRRMSWGDVLQDT